MTWQALYYIELSDLSHMKWRALHCSLLSSTCHPPCCTRVPIHITPYFNPLVNPRLLSQTASYDVARVASVRLSAEVEDLEATARGAGGFGSTGVAS